MIKIFVFLFVFFTIFGPKVGGWFDLSVIGSFGIFILSRSVRLDKHRIKTVRGIFSGNLLAVFSLIVFYGLIAFLFGEARDFNWPLRLTRASLNTIFIGFSVPVLLEGKVLSVKNLLRIVELTLLLNALIVILGIAFPFLQVLLSELYGYTKSIKDLRSFGLTAGLDSAGFLCVSGFALSSLRAASRRDKLSFVFVFIFCLSTLFTSRSSILLLLTIASLLIFFILSRRRVSWPVIILASSIGFIGAISAVYFIVLPTVDLNFWVGDDAGLIFGRRLIYNYSTIDPSSFLNQMYIFPSQWIHLVFGYGDDRFATDSGYIRIIFYGGTSYLFLFIYFYYLAFSKSKLRIKGFHGRSVKIPIYSIVRGFFGVFLLILLLGNLKNLYFFTRGYHELFMILYSINLYILFNYNNLLRIDYDSTAPRWSKKTNVQRDWFSKSA